jgi:glycosyltransferase involved in cell wall biosynthesis
MVKNEHKRLHVTLESVKDAVQSIVMYDTGSTDDTIEIAHRFCGEHKIPLRLKTGEFVDFSTSRNVSLEFADTFPEIDYLLLMDTNDELRGGDTMKKYCAEYLDKVNTGFLVCQEWFCGQYDRYWNMRLIKARQGWRYFGRVHEWLKNTRYVDDEAAQAAGDVVIRVDDKMVLYQDRTQDDDKSGKRFARDKELLLQDHRADPTEPRTVFYLAQTCKCLQDNEDSFYYYKLRSTMVGGFWEETFHAYLQCGELSEIFGHPWDESMKWYIKAFEHVARVEPLIKIAEHYRDKNWLLAFTFADLACKLSYPEQCILWIDKYAYEYKRWHLLGLTGWYSGFRERGRIGCQKAIESNINVELDKQNMKYYEDAEKAAKQDIESKMTKQQFIEVASKELAVQFPSLSRKQLVARANLRWKARK